MTTSPLSSGGSSAILTLFDLWRAAGPPEALAKLRKLGRRYGDYYMHAYFALRGPAVDPRVQFWSYWKEDFFWIGTWAMTMQPGMRWYNRNYANNWWFPSMTGRYGEPMSTIRLELAREGMEDYEYLWLLRDHVARMKASQQTAAGAKLLARAEDVLKRAEGVGGDFRPDHEGDYRFSGYLTDPLALLALRHDVAETLEGLARLQLKGVQSCASKPSKAFWRPFTGVCGAPGICGELQRAAPED